MIVDKKWSFNYEYDYYFYTKHMICLGMVKIRNNKAIFICNDEEEGRIYLGYKLCDSEIIFEAMKIIKKKQYLQLKKIEDELFDFEINTEQSTKTIWN